jgi:uncharacterized protein YceK
MKKLIIILIASAILSSCGSTHKCKGNASWYGNRNLGTTIQSDSTFVATNFITKSKTI